MLISHKHRFIFIHIFKTAGTSVRHVFLPYSRLIDRMAYEIRVTNRVYREIINWMNWHDDGMKQFTGYHKHAKAHEIRDKLGRELYDAYFKFSFVRNPYDFLVSLYFYIKQGVGHPDHDRVSKMEFKDFLKWQIEKGPPRQMDFLTDPESGRLIVDYIGRVETLQDDVDAIFKHLGITPERTLSKKNVTSMREGRDYRTFYDDESRSLVEEHFARDLDTLKYDFEGPTEEREVASAGAAGE